MDSLHLMRVAEITGGKFSVISYPIHGVLVAFTLCFQVNVDQCKRLILNDLFKAISR